MANEALLVRLGALAAQERESLADVIEHLMEFDRRELALDLAYPSLFAFCVHKLGYSEGAAFSRIRAARAAAHFPDVLPRLRSGRLHLEAIVRLYPHLDQDNSSELLDLASGASKRDVLALVAQLQSEPDERRDVIIPVRAPAAETPPVVKRSGDLAEQPAAQIVPPLRHRFHFTADAELLSLVERLRALLRHKIPDGRLERIFKEAAQTLLHRIERDKNPAKPRAADPTSPPAARPRWRTVPRAVQRAVWARDGGRCAFVGPNGLRCESREAIEYDHIVPWADGGRSDTPDNIRLLCRPHNLRLGRKRFGSRPRP